MREKRADPLDDLQMNAIGTELGKKKINKEVEFILYTSTQTDL